MKSILIITIFLFEIIQLKAQSSQNVDWMRFHYTITSEKLNDLGRIGFFITDTLNHKYILCNGGHLKCLITETNGKLTIDPWAIIINTDPCAGKPGVVNSRTQNVLTLDLNRKLIGTPTKVIVIPYQTWLLSANTIQIKIRPALKNMYTYNAGTSATGSIPADIPSSVSSGSINLGLSFGHSWGWTYFTHRSSSSYSITPSLSLNFSSESIKGDPLKSPADSTFTFSSGNLIISPSANLIIARNDVGLIFSYGWDLMTGRYSSLWGYQVKGYFGLGLSLGFKL